MMDKNIIEGFEPLLCFATNPRQTPEEVFEMLQQRMITILGREYYRKGLSLINWSPDNAVTFNEMEAIVDWQEADTAFSVKDFDRLGECVDVYIADVLGLPRIEPSIRTTIEAYFGNHNVNTEQEPDFIDPVAAFVVVSALEKFDELAEQKFNNKKGDK